MFVKDVFKTPDELAVKVATAVGYYQIHGLEAEAWSGDREAIVQLSGSGYIQANRVLTTIIEHSATEDHHRT